MKVFSALRGSFFVANGIAKAKKTFTIEKQAQGSHGALWSIGIVMIYI